MLFQAGEVSTQAVLDQEQRIIGYAREGKDRFRPLAPGRSEGLEGLSDEQAAAVRHVWNSRDGLMLIRGAPGAGKTTMMKPALDRLGVPAVLLAPSADASRDSLRRSGFADANTVAAFLGQADMQQQARGGVIWIDEAALLPIDDLERVCALAEGLKARIVLQGDPRQHKAVQRHGNMLRNPCRLCRAAGGRDQHDPAPEGRVRPGRRGNPRRPVRAGRRPALRRWAGSSRARGMTS